LADKQGEDLDDVQPDEDEEPLAPFESKTEARDGNFSPSESGGDGDVGDDGEVGGDIEVELQVGGGDDVGEGGSGGFFDAAAEQRQGPFDPDEFEAWMNSFSDPE
jgi:hypothetical protein